jgi:hypothetical protein
MATKISMQGLQRPSPRWWRNVERAFLLVLIPSAVMMIQSWKFDDELQAARLTVLISVGLTAIIKAIGMLLVDTEDNYVSNLTETEQEIVEVNPIKDKTDKNQS